MKSRKKLVGLGILTYVLGIVIFLVISYLVLVFLPEIEDWELFGFNFYSVLLFYGVAILPYLLFASLIKLDKVKTYLVLGVMFLSVELISFLMSGQSIIISIFTDMLDNENYILIAYPLTLLISYFISKRILRVKF
ncbi:hypothetical protein [Zunongwangia profunda]|jgi:hypothetical protein|uniref:hypothetical protein n=1 Tax=Zunongwangia profunda TaxID=398743 RepID=UPI001D183AC3|nr:hypothetical protein [Zunongwangia profunda]MCC4230056.1 hypothetical protein [Zunongwangia profunda]|tara:strand:- start:293 stop:700 length:408 start_codon:yes stop_codon:yes gene_type:complete